LLKGSSSEAERLVTLGRSLTHRRHRRRLIVTEAIVGTLKGLLENIKVNAERSAVQASSLGSGTTKIDLVEVHDTIAAFKRTRFRRSSVQSQ
jgi:hypothetical protein